VRTVDYPGLNNLHIYLGAFQACSQRTGYFAHTQLEGSVGDAAALNWEGIGSLWPDRSQHHCPLLTKWVSETLTHS